MEPIIPVIDGSDALAMLAEAVERKGSEHMYESQHDPEGMIPGGCLYIHGTELVHEGHDDYGDSVYVEVATDCMQPGCIVGNALVGRGVPMEKFVNLKVNQDTPVDDLLGVFVDHGIVGEVNEAAQDVFRAAQTCQDQGISWGTAYIRARESLGMYQD